MKLDDNKIYSTAFVKFKKEYKSRERELGWEGDGVTSPHPPHSYISLALVFGLNVSMEQTFLDNPSRPLESV